MWHSKGVWQRSINKSIARNLWWFFCWMRRVDAVRVKMAQFFITVLCSWLSWLKLKRESSTITCNWYRTEENQLLHAWFLSFSFLCPFLWLILRDWFCHNFLYGLLKVMPESHWCCWRSELSDFSWSCTHRNVFLISEMFCLLFSNFLSYFTKLY